MQIYTYPKFPEQCVLLEWNEDQQSSHFNEVKKGRPDIQLNSNGFSVVHVCKNHDEAYLIARYIDDVMKGKTPTRDGRILNTKEVIRHIKSLIKFSKAYSKVIKKNENL